MEELMELLASLKPEIDFETEKELIDDGLLVPVVCQTKYMV